MSETSLLIQDYLKKHSLEDLERDHGVKASICRHKASFNYDQLESRPDDQLACQCRGLVLSTWDGSDFPVEGVVGLTYTMAWPFDRFFNYGESTAAKIDWSTAVVREKLDGTLCILYYDPFDSEWCVATRSDPVAGHPIDGFGQWTFRTLFEEAWNVTTGLSFMTAMYDPTDHDFIGADLKDAEACFLFELTAPQNQVVVRYPEPRLHLLGIRTYWGEELLIDLWSGVIGVPAAPSHGLGSLEDVCTMVADRSPSEHEGVVVCDGEFRRIKVKSAAYVAAHRLRDKVASPRRLLQIILLGKLDDVYSLLAEHVQRQADMMRERLTDWMRAHQDGIAFARQQTDGLPLDTPERERRKTFALACKEAKVLMGPAMLQWEGRIPSVSAWLEAKVRESEYPRTFLDGMLAAIGDAT